MLLRLQDSAVYNVNAYYTYIYNSRGTETEVNVVEHKLSLADQNNVSNTNLETKI